MKTQQNLFLLLFTAIVLAISPTAFAARPFVAIAGIEYAAPTVSCDNKSTAPSDNRCVNLCINNHYAQYSHVHGSDNARQNKQQLLRTFRSTCRDECPGSSANFNDNPNSCLDNVINGFTKMLETSIVKTNKMAVYEREQLNPVLAEQLAGQAGLTNRGGKLGGLDGVDYIVSGSITKFGGKTESSGISGEVLGLFGSGRGQGILGEGVAQSKSTWEMAVDIKVVDVSTGQIVAAETVESQIISGSKSNIAGLQSGNQEADFLSDLQRDVARKIAALIVTQKFPIRSVSVSDDIISLNYNDSVLSVGECLNMYSLGESIIDPDTGESLGEEEVLAGSIAVIETNSKFSKAEADDGFNPQKGMIARKTECIGERAKKEAPPKKDSRRSKWNDK